MKPWKVGEAAKESGGKASKFFLRKVSIRCYLHCCLLNMDLRSFLHLFLIYRVECIEHGDLKAPWSMSV